MSFGMSAGRCEVLDKIQNFILPFLAFKDCCEVNFMLHTTECDIVNPQLHTTVYIFRRSHQRAVELVLWSLLVEARLGTLFQHLFYGPFKFCAFFEEQFLRL